MKALGGFNITVWINEQIRTSEVVLTGFKGEKLGTVSREEALNMARSQSADLVCTSLMSSPLPCSLRRQRLPGEAESKVGYGLIPLTKMINIKAENNPFKGQELLQLIS